MGRALRCLLELFALTLKQLITCLSDAMNRAQAVTATTVTVTKLRQKSSKASKLALPVGARPLPAVAAVLKQGKETRQDLLKISTKSNK